MPISETCMRTFAAYLLLTLLSGCSSTGQLAGDLEHAADDWPRMNARGKTVPVTPGMVATYPLDSGGIALCFSGGGYRATLFHAGVAARLNRAGFLQRAHRIAGVSGGSLTAAMIGLNWSHLRFEDGVATNFDEVVLQPILAMVDDTIDLPSIVIGALTPSNASHELARRLDKILLSKRLADFPEFGKGPQVLLLATDMRTGDRWVFSRHVAGSERYGYVLWPRFDVATAVAASAGFPPILAPARIRISEQAAVFQGRYEVIQPNLNELRTRTYYLAEVESDPLFEAVVKLRSEMPQQAEELGRVLNKQDRGAWTEQLKAVDGNLRLADGGILSNSGYESCNENALYFISSATPEAERVVDASDGWMSTSARTVDLIHRRAEEAAIQLYSKTLIPLGGECTEATPPKRTRCGVRISLARESARHRETNFDAGLQRVSLPTRLKAIDTDTAKLVINWGYAAANDALVDSNLSQGDLNLPFHLATWEKPEICEAIPVSVGSTVRAVQCRPINEPNR